MMWCDSLKLIFSYISSYSYSCIYVARYIPIFPRGPLSPISPLGPGGPVSPLSPFNPISPLLPGGPLGPGMPSLH